MEVDQSSPSPEDGSGLSGGLVDLEKYSRPETSDWMAKEIIAYWKSLDERRKQEILTIYTYDLVNFSSTVMQQPWLEHFLRDAVALFHLHGTWEMYVCPDPACSRLFKDDESLMIHLRRDHFSQIYSVARSPSQNNLAEQQRFADALCKMVWKPIDVEAALDLLSTMCLDYDHITMADVCDGSDRLASLNWTFSDDLRRKSLLAELEKGFQVLLAKRQEQASFSLISDGLFMRMTALASKLVFIGHSPRYNVSFLQCLLAHSPLSFCLLGTKHLYQFVLVVEQMCQLYLQDASCSAKQEIGSTQFESGWINSEILAALSTSLGAVSVKKAPLSHGGWESLLLSLCHAPSIPSIQSIPIKAAATFSRVQDILTCLSKLPTFTGLPHRTTAVYQLCDIPWDTVSLKLGESFNPGSKRHLHVEPYCFYKDPNKLMFSESQFEPELCSIRHVHELQYYESQLRQLCTVNCQMHMSLLIGSLLRLKLYICMEMHALGLEGFPVLYRTSYQKGNTEPNVNCDGSESEYDSDYEANEPFSYILESDETGSIEDSDCEDDVKSEKESECDMELDDKPWNADPVLCMLDETLSESATGEAEGSGPFFWMVTSDVWRHSAKRHDAAGYNSVIEGIRRFRTNKMWKYWLCYSCNETFTDPEIHMAHLVDKHQLCLAHEDFLLIPEQYSLDAVDDWRQDAVKREPALEDSITLDHSYGYFLVDSAMFDQMPSVHEEEELGQAKRKKYMEIIHGLRSEFCSLECIFRMKREYLTYLEVVNALGLMSCIGGEPHAFLESWLHKLHTRDWIAGLTHRQQFEFLSELLNRATHPVCPSSNNGQKVLESMRNDLICKIDCQDKKIVEGLVRIDVMKRNLSEHCVCDYRTKILPSVRSSLHSKFRFDDGVISLGCNSIRKLLSSINNKYVGADSFNVVVKSPGKVIFNARKNKSSWGIAFLGISLDFVGEWSLAGESEKATGGFKFGGWINWGRGGYRCFERVIPDNTESRLAIESDCVRLNIFFSRAVIDMFFFLCNQYIKQNSGDLGVVASAY